MCWSNQFVENLINGTLSGVGAAAVWAGIVWIYQIKKDHSISSSMMKCIRETRSVTETVDGIGIVLKNNTRWPFIVREVTVRTNRGSAILNYVGKVEPEYGGKHILLKPKTEGRWVTNLFTKLEPLKQSVIHSIDVTVEYSRLFGETVVTTISTSKEHFQMLDQMKNQDIGCQ
jgi:hypothetical protein